MNSLFQFCASDSTGSVFSALTVASEPVRRSRAATHEPPKALVSAVYSHIRAVRALGRETINTNEIAKALSLPPRDVERAVAALTTKGVRKLSK